MRFNTCWLLALNLAFSLSLTPPVFSGFPLELKFSVSHEKAPVGNLRAIAKRQIPSGAVELDLIESQTFYHTLVRFGSAEEPVNLLIDTGAVSTWVISKDVKCFGSLLVQVDPRMERRQETEDKVKSQIIPDIFTGFRSSSSSAIPGTNLPEIDPRQCTANGAFDNTKSTSFRVFEDLDPYDITFQDNTFARGRWGQDTLLLGGVKVENVPFALVHKTDNTIGILGLGSDNLKNVCRSCTQYPADFKGFPLILKEQGHIKRAVFSLFLDKQAERGGSVLFGAVDHAKYYGKLQTVAFSNYYDQYSETPLFFDVGLDSISVKEPGKDNIHIPVGRLALLDSGGTLCAFPKDILTPLAEALNGIWHEHLGLYQIDRTNIKLKHLSFWISSIKINIPATRFIVRIKAKDYLGISIVDHDRLVLGEEFLRSAYVVFDTERNEVSMAQAKYSSRKEVELVTGDIPRAVRAGSGSGSGDLVESGFDSDISLGSTLLSDIRRVHFLDVPRIIEPENDSGNSLLSRPPFPKMGLSALKKPSAIQEIQKIDEPANLSSLDDLEDDSAIKTVEEALGFLEDEPSNDLSMEDLEFLAEGLSFDRSLDDHLSFVELLDTEMLKDSPVLTRVRKSADLNNIPGNDETPKLIPQIEPVLLELKDGPVLVEETGPFLNSDEVITEAAQNPETIISGNTEVAESIETGGLTAILFSEIESLKASLASSIFSVEVSKSSTFTTVISLIVSITFSTDLLETTTTSSKPESLLLVSSSALRTYQNQTSLFQQTSVYGGENIITPKKTSDLDALITPGPAAVQAGSPSRSIDGFRLDLAADIQISPSLSKVSSVLQNVLGKPNLRIASDFQIKVLGGSEGGFSQFFSNNIRNHSTFYTQETTPEVSQIFRFPNITKHMPFGKDEESRTMVSIIDETNYFINLAAAAELDISPEIHITFPDRTEELPELLNSNLPLNHSDTDLETLPKLQWGIMRNNLESNHVPNFHPTDMEFQDKNTPSDVLENLNLAIEFEGFGNRASRWPGVESLILSIILFALLI